MVPEITVVRQPESDSVQEEYEGLDEDEEEETKPNSSSRVSTENSLEEKPPVPRHLKPTKVQQLYDSDDDDVKKPYLTDSDEDIGDSKDLQLTSSDDEDNIEGREYPSAFRPIAKPVVFDPRYNTKPQTSHHSSREFYQDDRQPHSYHGSRDLQKGMPFRPAPPPPVFRSGAHVGPYGSRDLQNDETSRGHSPAQWGGSREAPTNKGYGFGYEDEPPVQFRSLNDTRLPEPQGRPQYDYEEDYKPWQHHGFKESSA